MDTGVRGLISTNDLDLAVDPVILAFGTLQDEAPVSRQSRLKGGLCLLLDHMPQVSLGKIVKRVLIVSHRSRRQVCAESDAVWFHAQSWTRVVASRARPSVGAVEALSSACVQADGLTSCDRRSSPQLVGSDRVLTQGLGEDALAGARIPKHNDGRTNRQDFILIDVFLGTLQVQVAQASRNSRWHAIIITRVFDLCAMTMQPAWLRQ